MRLVGATLPLASPNTSPVSMREKMRLLLPGVFSGSYDGVHRSAHAFPAAFAHDAHGPLDGDGAGADDKAQPRRPRPVLELQRGRRAPGRLAGRCRFPRHPAGEIVKQQLA